MEQRNGMSYKKLYNLEPLMNFPLPQGELDSSGNSSEGESTSSQGQGAVSGYANGGSTDMSSDHLKRRNNHGMNSYTSGDVDSDDQDYEENNYRISEQYYHEMVGGHAQKYRKINSSDPTETSVRMTIPNAKLNHSLKAHIKNEPMFCETNNLPEYYKPKFESNYKKLNSSSIDASYLDIGDGIRYKIPPTYDKLANSLKLPSYSDIKISEYFLKGTLDVRSLSAFVASDKRFEARTKGGMPEPQPQYDSLQARLKALYASNSSQKFTLQVYDVGLDAIPEGAPGKIRRTIMSESGNLQVYYVKVLERGDTYEIIERSLPKKQTVNKDHSVIEKEEMDKIGKFWVNIARRDIPRHHRSFTNLHKKHIADAKRFSETCQREVKMKVSRSIKLMRGAAIRTKKLARDMLLYWKRIDREQAEQRKIKEKEAAEALKREEELREAKRQKQRLNFLLSQTELYSHFMQNKSSQPSETLPIEDHDVAEGLSAFDEEDPEEAELKREALLAAQNAVSQQKKITNLFDDESSKLRKAAETTDAANDPEISGASNIDLLNPSTMPATSSVQTPELFKGNLKDYQLKGLQWLVNCYEQGLNGILADEMGLGKTIQAMAFLAHLAEEKNIWGPFLVVAPSSVLNNWNDEIGRFIPDLKTLPYWGSSHDRNKLRKKINPKRLYRRESGFHILITSYQLLVTDEKLLKRVKWQYMVLDEAQAIKSSNSQRWKTLLTFNCRNRLLLTGTPIQNNMAELWALLHFIMPTLFDSHEQFNEWFSKGIESHAEHGGTLNEHQLSRLHAVLKPFMLRRIKKDVIEEMTTKTEIMVHCKLSSRQQAFYQAIKNKFSLAEFLDSSRGRLNDKKLVNLMNIVIQLRKVCNHPELFERNEGSSFFHFAEIPNSLVPAPFGELEDVHYSGHSNPISYKVPKLVYEDIICNSFMMGKGVRCNTFEKFFSIFSPQNIHRSSLSLLSHEGGVASGSFGFVRLMDISPVEATFIAKCSILERLMYSIIRWEKQTRYEALDLFLDSKESKERAVARMLLIPTKSEASILRRKLTAASDVEPLVISHDDRFISSVRVLRSSYGFIPKVRAPPISAQCSDRGFAYQTVEYLHHPWAKKMLLGFARTSDFNGPGMPTDSHHLIREVNTESSLKPILELPYQIFGSSPPMRSFDPAKMLTDSGKLQTLDILLKQLRAGNHRVLLFAQMTKMLNIIEDYMNFRKYKYFRLDGSSSITDRRDMVRDFQERNDVFVFLLSTRAGGLGINLTAADTVIFYESDWNPTLDLQAMDRAHRLGQTKTVTVYRLICKETVEEKILQRASQKNTVQQLVMTGGHVQGDLLKPEDVVSLLIDDAQLEQKIREIPLQVKDRQRKKKPAKGIRVDADGVVSLEDVDNPNVSLDADHGSAGPNIGSSSKKRSSRPDSQYPPRQRNPSKSKNSDTGHESYAMEYNEDNTEQQRAPRSKRLKSVNENLEPSFGSVQYKQQSSYDYGDGTN